jgi:hypothetical protein
MDVIDPSKPKNEAPCVACKACKWVTSHPNLDARYSTSKMVSHLRECKRYIARQDKTAIDLLVEQAQAPYRATKMTNAKLTEDVLNAAVYSNLSWTSATNPHWTKLWAKAWPKVVPPSRKSLPALLTAKAAESRADLKARLCLNNSKISLALDGWSVGHMSFQGM